MKIRSFKTHCARIINSNNILQSQNFVAVHIYVFFLGILCGIWNNHITFFHIGIRIKIYLAFHINNKNYNVVETIFIVRLYAWKDKLKTKQWLLEFFACIVAFDGF